MPSSSPAVKKSQPAFDLLISSAACTLGVQDKLEEHHQKNPGGTKLAATLSASPEDMALSFLEHASFSSLFLFHASGNEHWVHTTLPQILSVRTDEQIAALIEAQKALTQRLKDEQPTLAIELGKELAPMLAVEGKNGQLIHPIFNGSLQPVQTVVEGRRIPSLGSKQLHWGETIAPTQDDTGEYTFFEGAVPRRDIEEVDQQEMSPELIDQFTKVKKLNKIFTTTIQDHYSNNRPTMLVLGASAIRIDQTLTDWHLTGQQPIPSIDHVSKEHQKKLVSKLGLEPGQYELPRMKMNLEGGRMVYVPYYADKKVYAQNAQNHALDCLKNTAAPYALLSHVFQNDATIVKSIKSELLDFPVLDLYTKKASDTGAPQVVGLKQRDQQRNGGKVVQSLYRTDLDRVEELQSARTNTGWDIRALAVGVFNQFSYGKTEGYYHRSRYGSLTESSKEVDRAELTKYIGLVQTDSLAFLYAYNLTRFEHLINPPKEAPEHSPQYRRTNDLAQTWHQQTKAHPELLENIKKLAPLIESSKELLSAAQGFMNKFTEGSLDEALRVQNAWLKKNDFLEAWQQASDAPEFSARSLAWAKLNPLATKASGDNPKEQYLGRCAFVLGLRSSAPLEPQFVNALGAYGLTQQGADYALSHMAILDLLTQKIQNSKSVQVEVKELNWAKVEFAISLLNQAVKVQMDPSDAHSFLTQYFTQLEKTGAYGARKTKTDYWDWIGPGTGKVGVISTEGAVRHKELDLAKKEHHPKFIEALIEDFLQTKKCCTEAQLPAEQIEATQLQRAREIMDAMPMGWVGRINWSAKPFDLGPAWAVLGIESPQLSTAIQAANNQKTPIGVWCAKVAKVLGVQDAKDGIDLVSKVKQKLKARNSISDGVWKNLSKDEAGVEILNALTQHNQEAFRADLWCIANKQSFESSLITSGAEGMVPNAKPLYLMEKKGITYPSLMDKSGAIEPISNEDFGWVITQLIQLGTSVEHVKIAKDLLLSKTLSPLFNPHIKPLVLQDHEASGYYVNEGQAKRQRIVPLLKDAIRVYEHELKKKTESGEIQTPTQAMKKLTDELTLYCDWMNGSELGIWQEQSATPTLKQLQRQSELWHQEQVALANDKMEKNRLRSEKDQQAQSAQEKDALEQGANVFKHPVGRGWPKVVGYMRQDGWEAVELISAADLTEEGARMSHCVSSYSGQCRSGESRIFSVRLNAERICTLQLRRKDEKGAYVTLGDADAAGTFEIVQNRGKHNASVSRGGALEFCESVRQMADQEWVKIIKKRQAILEKKRLEKAAEASALAKTKKAHAI